MENQAGSSPSVQEISDVVMQQRDGESFTGCPNTPLPDYPNASLELPNGNGLGFVPSSPYNYEGVGFINPQPQANGVHHHRQ